MPDTPGQAATNPDTNYSLTVEDAGMLYARAGHPRTPRTIQRYCASGHLDCIKAATALGDKYFINAGSVDRHIAQTEELIALEKRATGRDLSRLTARDVAPQLVSDTPRPDSRTGEAVSATVADSSVQHEGASPPAESDEPRRSTTSGEVSSRPFATEEIAAPRHVAHLEREVDRLNEDRNFLRDQIKTKDVQIAALLERDRETNILVGSLQRMLAPLLGGWRGDPPSTDTQSSHQL